MPNQKTMWTRFPGGFSVIWVTKLFCPKTTQFGPKLAFLSIAGSFGALLVGWLLVVAWAVSRKSIYFIIAYVLKLWYLSCRLSLSGCLWKCCQLAALSCAPGVKIQSHKQSMQRLRCEWSAKGYFHVYKNEILCTPASKPVLTFKPMMVADLTWSPRLQSSLTRGPLHMCPPSNHINTSGCKLFVNFTKKWILTLLHLCKQHDGLLPLSAIWFCWASHWCRHSWKFREWDLQKQQQWYLQS